MLKLLKDLVHLLNDLRKAGYNFSPAQISYVFFPISQILRRNASPAIPDQVFEHIFAVLSILCEDWWWFCEVSVWQQIFMLSGAIIGGIEAKGKEKQRDDETKEAAAHCLFSLLRIRTTDSRSVDPETRMSVFQEHARSKTFVPILGQTLNAVLVLTESHHLSLQRVSLDVLALLIDVYSPDYLIPSVLPGVVSSMAKLALGSATSKGWTNGEIVAKSLSVMRSIVIRSIGDEICKREGAIRVVEDLEDFASIGNNSETTQSKEDAPMYATQRTPSWLRGTTSQLHIALNTLTPLVKHPTPSALIALAEFSASVLSQTTATLPQSQPLLLSFLLSLSVSDYPNVSRTARDSLVKLLTTKSPAQFSLMQTLMHHTRDNLSLLPRFLTSQADEKIAHVAGLIEAVCRISSGLHVIASEIGKILGSAGGIEKWGWSLLSVLEFVNPPVTITRTSPAQLMLENDSSSSQWMAFPELTLKNVSTRSTYDALVRMLHALGFAAGDACLPAVEWFANVGQSGKGSRAVAALWCASQLLQGVANFSILSPLETDVLSHPRSKRLEKFTRELAKSTAQLWDDMDETPAEDPPSQAEESSDVSLVKGVNPIHETLRIIHPSSLKQPAPVTQPMLQKSIALQLLATTAGILQARFVSLFIYTLYPILRSLVSPVSHLSSTALATLTFVTISTSYASPANLLMSNFDYALDAISRKLTRRWLDVDATKVLIIMIHIIGNDVVERASDVVEECFDRLDDFHGYGVIVEGLVQVLGEVVNVIKTEDDFRCADQTSAPLGQSQRDQQQFEALFTWLSKEKPVPSPEEAVDYEPAPRQAWGDLKKETEGEDEQERGLHDESPPTPPQLLTKQIVNRSMYFLTHSSPAIRARILSLLTTSAPILPESSLMPAIHDSWPFILNRLADQEGFVVSAVASLIEALTVHHGGYMFRRIWDDVWPRFHKMLAQLDASDGTNALARRGYAAVGTESAYTHSHRLYRSLMRTMTAAVEGVHPQDSSIWEVIISFRRFLQSHAHEELQQSARDLYVAIGNNNADAVWLALHATIEEVSPVMTFLRQEKWSIKQNVDLIFESLDK